jgi:hypothetical protein
MTKILFCLALIAMLAVLVVLGAGLFSLVRGGAFRKNWSNRLMRLRVLFQAIAIGLLVILAWAMKNHP